MGLLTGSTLWKYDNFNFFYKTTYFAFDQNSNHFPDFLEKISKKTSVINYNCQEFALYILFKSFEGISQIFIILPILLI